MWAELSEIKAFIEKHLKANPNIQDEWVAFDYTTDIHISISDATGELEFWVYPIIDGETDTRSVYFQLVF